MRWFEEKNRSAEKKPFCDGIHAKIVFDGTETASRKSFVDQANVFDGPSRPLKKSGTIAYEA